MLPDLSGGITRLKSRVIGFAKSVAVSSLLSLQCSSAFELKVLTRIPKENHAARKERGLQAASTLIMAAIHERPKPGAG